MWNQFLLQNAHFALSLFAALVFFAVFWLYYDALQPRRQLGAWLKAFGFLALSLSFAVSAMSIESTILTTVLQQNSFIQSLQIILRILGYTGIIIGLSEVKIQTRPVVVAALSLPIQVSLIVILHLLSPVLALLITILYAREALIGLEAHLKPVMIAFGILTLSELFSLATLFQATNNIQLYNLVAPFGPFWIIQRLILLVSCVILGRWVFGYLLKQFRPQLFFIINVMIVVIFLISTVSFTGLLLRNIQDETFRQLMTDLKVLQFSLNSKQAEHTSDAILVAKDPALAQAVIGKDRAALNTITQSYIITKKYSSLVVLDQNGQVIARGEDSEKIGNILTNELLVRRATENGPTASLEIKEGVLSPQVLVSAAAPIQSADQTIGTVVLSTSIDNAFVDGIKKATGLEASIYGSNTLSATTLLSSDEKTRLVGIKEENQRIVGNVLQEGNSVNTSVDIANAPFFASYVPLSDTDGSPIGMMSVARTQVSILQTAGRSIELTFIIATIMLIVSIIPSYLIARYMANQL